MTTTKNFILAALISKFVGLRIFVKNEVANPNLHPRPMMRCQLEGFLRFTQAEMLEAFGVKSPQKLESKKLRRAVAILARIHKGSDSYKTLAEKAEVLIKRLQPLHKAELERALAERKLKVEQEALLQRFLVLSGGKVLPDGTENRAIQKMVTDLREEIAVEVKALMEEVAESAYFHPEPGRISDRNLVELRKRLSERLKQLRAQRPVTQRPFAALGAGITLH